MNMEKGAAVPKVKGKQQKGNKNRKYGRHKRGASNASQSYRTAKNKRLNIEKEERLQLFYSKRIMKVPHGYTRAISRYKSKVSREMGEPIFQHAANNHD